MTTDVTAKDFNPSNNDLVDEIKTKANELAAVINKMPASRRRSIALTHVEPSTAQDFGREIAAVYASLSEGQEPLGAEFEAVWDANVADLYES